MLQSVRSSRSQAGERARVTLLWTLALVVGGQVALALALNLWRPLRDPEYGWRLQSLRARIAEREPGAPVVLFLGSSRTALGVRPGCLAANQSASRTEPVVFNFGLCRSGPILELLCLRRLLDDGIRPTCIFVEAWPAIAASAGAAQVGTIQPERLSGEDYTVLAPYATASYLDSDGWDADLLVPWHAHRTHLLNQWAPSWVVPKKRQSADWAGLDKWGWLELAPMKNDDGKARVRIAESGKGYVAAAKKCAASEASRRAWSEMFALCRRQRIDVVLVAMPDPLLGKYSPEGRRRIRACVHDLANEHDLPLVDAQDWSPVDDFFDSVHLSHHGAEAFTERLQRDALRPYLSGSLTAKKAGSGLTARAGH